MNAAAIKIISLSSANRRREVVLGQPFFLARTPVVVDAVFGREIAWKGYSASSRSADFLDGRRLSAGEVGCALSHLAIYETIDDESGSTVVFEDDVIQSQATEALFFAEFQRPLSGSYVCIYGCQQGLKLAWFWKVSWIFWYVFSGSARMPVPTFLVRRLYRTAAYRISGSAAQSIARASSGGLRCADDFAGHQADTGANFFFTPIFLHPKDLGDSEIEHERS